MKGPTADRTGTGPAPDAGFSTAEKALGAWAAYEHPLVSSVVAGKMLQTEPDPTRRRQLVTFRSAALVWWPSVPWSRSSV